MVLTDFSTWRWSQELDFWFSLFCSFFLRSDLAWPACRKSRYSSLLHSGEKAFDLDKISLYIIQVLKSTDEVIFHNYHKDGALIRLLHQGPFPLGYSRRSRSKAWRTWCLHYRSWNIRQRYVCIASVWRREILKSNPNTAILMIADVWGWSLNNTRVLADKYAQGTGARWVFESIWK